MDYFFRLFNIVCDTDKTASTVLQTINKMKLPGEVNLMPLNKLNFKDLQYPKSPVCVNWSHMNSGFGLSLFRFQYFVLNISL